MPARSRSRFPAILWIASNVHGGEESGTDASMRVLYELADRDDCAARQILDNSIVVLLPTQNPDGRELNTRQNFYGFDMNRDWFARTQPETDGKLELLRQYPGPLFVDDHEMGASTFFFPPNADPIYHEITDESVDWINNIYGASLASEFNRQGIPFFNRDIYDLFYMGYGDTVPATGFISAGMTYEKNNGEPIAKRAYEQYVAQWVQPVSRRDPQARDPGGLGVGVARGLPAGSSRLPRAKRDRQPGQRGGDRGPDRAAAPLLHHRAPRLEAARGQGDDPAAPAHGRRRLPPGKAHLGAATSHPTAGPPRGQWMARGTWYVPMAQMQKHWVQAMLNEDTYTPFPYFYDVTAWSQPLLFNVRGGYSGERLRLRARGVDELADPGAPRRRPTRPKIAVFQLSADLHVGDRVDRLAALSARTGLGAAVRQARRRPDRRRRAQRLRRGADRQPAPAEDGATALGTGGGATPCAPGSTTAATSSAGARARAWPRSSA